MKATSHLLIVVEAVPLEIVNMHATKLPNIGSPHPENEQNWCSVHYPFALHG
jgi:hypothetical protein